MKHRIGRTRVEVMPIGLGGMPLSIQGRPDEDMAIKVIHAALDAGVDFIDTADVYCLDDRDLGHNERLIAKALKTHPSGSKAVLATKGGLIRPSGAWVSKADPDHLRQACEKSLKNLDQDAIFLYQLHAPDAQVPFADSVGALLRLQEEGKIEYIGLSNITLELLEEAEKIARIESVQNRCNLFTKRDLRNGLVEACSSRGISFIAHSPVGGWRGHREAMQEKPIKETASRYQCSSYQVALAWLMAKGKHILPIPGASRAESIQDSVKSIDIRISSEDLDILDGLEDV